MRSSIYRDIASQCAVSICNLFSMDQCLVQTFPHHCTHYQHRGTSIQMSEHIRQHCPAHRDVRRQPWLEEVELQEKLLGSAVALRKTADFILRTGLTFWAWLGKKKKRESTTTSNLFILFLCLFHSVYGPFNYISYHEFSRQLSAFSLCSSGLISALLVLWTIYLFMEVSFSPDIIHCGWLGLKHQLTN